MKINLLQTSLLLLIAIFITACGEVESETAVEQSTIDMPRKALAGAWTGKLDIYQSDINTTCEYDNLTIKFYEIRDSTEIRGSLIADRNDWVESERPKGCIELINQTFSGTFIDEALSFTIDLDGLSIPIQTSLSTYLLNGTVSDSNSSNYSLELKNYELKDILDIDTPDTPNIDGCTLAPATGNVDLKGEWTGLINNLSCYYELTINIGEITIVDASVISSISSDQCPPSLNSSGIAYIPTEDKVDFTINIDSNSSNTLNFVGSYNSQNMCGNAIHTYMGVEDSAWIWTVSKK